MVRTSLYLKAHGVFVLPVCALHSATRASRASSQLLGQIRDLLLAPGNSSVLLGNVSRSEPPVLPPDTSGADAAAAAAEAVHRTLRVHGMDVSVRALMFLGVLMAVTTALILGSLVLMMRRQGQESPAAPARSRAGPSRSRGNKDSAVGSESEARLSSSVSTPSASYDCPSEGPQGARPTQEEPSQPPLSLVPLCPQLTVPDTSNLQVVLPDLACRGRQNIILDICSIPSLGGRPLFRARVAECAPTPAESCGIHLETMSGEQQFAFVSTEELWAAPARSQTPKLPILRPDGLQFATMRKDQRGDYIIMCGLGTLAAFSGDFSAHEIKVTNSQGRIMAQTHLGSEGFYEVTTSPSVDAGLIILGLLAIAKCEQSHLS